MFFLCLSKCFIRHCECFFGSIWRSLVNFLIYSSLSLIWVLLMHQHWTCGPPCCHPWLNEDDLNCTFSIKPKLSKLHFLYKALQHYWGWEVIFNSEHSNRKHKNVKRGRIWPRNKNSFIVWITLRDSISLFSLSREGAFNLTQIFLFSMHACRW